jgi:alcohol dehydrogenase (cytochrome c)
MPQKKATETEMNRRLKIVSIALFALDAGVMGGITSSLADETGVEVGVGELRGEIMAST